MPSEFIIAVHAMAYLRKHPRLISSEELAENICVNPVRVRKVMAKLKAYGLIDTKQGLSGGYSFSIQNETVTLSQIYDALQMRIFHSNWRSGNAHLKCIVSSGMAQVMDDLYETLEATCYEKLKAISICDVVKELEQLYALKENTNERR